MRALLVETLGAPEAHRIAELPDPVADSGDVIVDVRAAALNFADLLVMKGLYQLRPDLPFVPGAEGSGVVSAIGSDVAGIAVGDEVSFIAVTGAFAEKVKLAAEMVLPKAAEQSFVEAAGFSLTYATSYYALKQRAALQPGETLVVLGAAGGVGAAAVELGKVMGARVIAAASSDEKLEFATSLGADAVINYSTTDVKAAIRTLTNGSGADVVYDPVGGDFSEPALRAMAWGGRYLVVGFAAGDIPSIPLNLTLLRSVSIVGVYWGSWVGRDPKGNMDNYQELLAMVGRGQIAPRVTEVFTLDEFVSAYEAISARRVKGKIVFDLS
ncbi:MAG: NADPH:quinone oxidoreductase family protein [bacterium]|nr:NADPH:quinone oxidoreductase family protein [bacterium]